MIREMTGVEAIINSTDEQLTALNSSHSVIKEGAFYSKIRHGYKDSSRRLIKSLFHGKTAEKLFENLNKAIISNEFKFNFESQNTNLFISTKILDYVIFFAHSFLAIDFYISSDDMRTESISLLLLHLSRRNYFNLQT